MPRLRRSDPNRPGITRRGRGRGFEYAWDVTGEKVEDVETLERIAGLVIPPAWKEVWICPWPHGHIQAVGTDAAGRRQYLYHPDWRRRRDGEKFMRALEFGAALPGVRRRVECDLKSEGMGERRVLAAAVRLLDIGCFRIGGENYARDHETFGVATLRKEHVRVRGDELRFTYPAKGAVERCLTVSDPEVTEVLAPLRKRRSGSDQLLAWRGKGGWIDIHSADINAYLKVVAGEQFSAKDFRTWTGTVEAAVQLARIRPIPASARGRRTAVTSVVRDVADHLGNTPAVCRASYIDPRVIDHFDEGKTIGDHGWTDSGRDSRRRAEKALLRLLGQGEERAAA